MAEQGNSASGGGGFTIPVWAVGAVVLLIVASWLPLALIARSRAVRSPNPRVHLWFDMDHQVKYKAQSHNAVFDPITGANADQHYNPAVARDGRAMRLPPDGAIARGELENDDHYHRGYETDDNLLPVIVTEGGVVSKKYIDGYPQRIHVSEKLLQRGRDRYEVFCSMCHGLAGYGDGPVHQRVQQLNLRAATGKGQTAQGWVQPKNLHDPTTLAMTTGQIFDTITNGKPTPQGDGYVMFPYGSSISTRDRWAIVAYVKALQLSQNAGDALSDEQKAELDAPQP